MHTLQRKNLMIAGVLAVLATLLTTIYVGSAGGHDKKASSDTTIFVATRDIPVGTPAGVAVESLHAAQVPASAAQIGAVTSRAQLSGLVTVQPIYRGEQVSLRRFAALREQGVLSDLHGRMRAFDVSGDGNQLLAGSLHDGDHVDVVASLKDPQTQRAYVRTVLRNIVVLHAPDQNGTSSNGSTSYAATLRVSDSQARTLFYVFKNADWALVLRPVVRPGDSADTTTSFASVLGGQG